MQITESHMLYLGGLIILFCIISLLPFKVQSRTSWILYFPIIPVCTYIVYEILMLTKFANTDIRIDLLLIGLLLIATVIKTKNRAEKIIPSPQGQVSQLAQSCFVLGWISILFYQWLVFSVAAVALGHIAQIKSRNSERFVGKRLVIAGLSMGYINLCLAMVLINSL